MKAKKLWYIFYDAYLQCPQAKPFDDCDAVDDFSVRKMKKNVSKCVSFWLSRDTVGGSVLWESGYSVELPECILEAVAEYRRQTRVIGKEIFTSLQ